MKIYATKPLSINENDLGLGLKNEPKDYSFSQKNVNKKEAKNLPDCTVVRSFIKQGILVEIKKKENEK